MTIPGGKLVPHRGRPGYSETDGDPFLAPLPSVATTQLDRVHHGDLFVLVFLQHVDALDVVSVAVEWVTFSEYCSRVRQAILVDVRGNLRLGGVTGKLISFMQVWPLELSFFCMLFVKKSLCWLFVFTAIIR